MVVWSFHALPWPNAVRLSPPPPHTHNAQVDEWKSRDTEAARRWSEQQEQVCVRECVSEQQEQVSNPTYLSPTSHLVALYQHQHVPLSLPAAAAAAADVYFVDEALD